MLARDRGWKEAVLDREQVWLLADVGGEGRLLTMPVGGGDPTIALSGLQAPSALLVREGRVFWLENHPPALSAFPHIPASAARTTLQVRDADGKVRLLGQWHAALAPARGDLISGPTRLYVRLRRMMATEFYEVNFETGGEIRVAVEAGTQEGLVSGEEFVWTTPSEEAASPEAFRSVRRRGADGNSRMVTDWLPGQGSLVEIGQSVFYAADRLYRVPQHLSEPHSEGSLPVGQVASDGRKLYLLTTNGPSVIPLTRQ